MDTADLAQLHQQQKGEKDEQRRQRQRRASANASRRGSLAGRLDAHKKRLEMATVPEGSEANANLPANDREALHRLFSRCAPDKIANIDAVLQKFDGQLDKMYLVLGRLYPNETIERPADITNSTLNLMG